jgi:hypothetical protein
MFYCLERGWQFGHFLKTWMWAELGFRPNGLIFVVETEPGYEQAAARLS